MAGHNIRVRVCEDDQMGEKDRVIKTQSVVKKLKFREDDDQGENFTDYKLYVKCILNIFL